MSLFQIATRALWILPLLLQSAIIVVMIRRGLARRFPVFFTYTAAIVILDSALSLCHYGTALYAVVYWWGDVLGVLLGLGSIIETLKYLFPPYPFLKPLWNVVWIAGGVAVLLSLALLIMTEQTPTADRMFQIIILVERSARFLEALLLLILMALMSRLGLTWNRYAIGIVTGFGIYSALAVLIFELRAHTNLLSDPLFVVLNSAAYNVGVIIWIVYFARKQNIVVEQLPEENLSEWNAAVTEYVNQWQRRS